MVNLPLDRRRNLAARDVDRRLLREPALGGQSERSLFRHVPRHHAPPAKQRKLGRGDGTGGRRRATNTIRVRARTMCTPAPTRAACFTRWATASGKTTVSTGTSSSTPSGAAMPATCISRRAAASITERRRRPRAVPSAVASAAELTRGSRTACLPQHPGFGELRYTRIDVVFGFLRGPTRIGVRAGSPAGGFAGASLRNRPEPVASSGDAAAIPEGWLLEAPALLARHFARKLIPAHAVLAASADRAFAVVSAPSVRRHLIRRCEADATCDTRRRIRSKRIWSVPSARGDGATTPVGRLAARADDARDGDVEADAHVCETLVSERFVGRLHDPGSSEVGRLRTRPSGRTPWSSLPPCPNSSRPGPKTHPPRSQFVGTARISDSEIGRVPSWMKYADLRARSATSTYCPGPSVHTAADHPTTPASGRARSMTHGGDKQ